VRHTKLKNTALRNEQANMLVTWVDFTNMFTHSFYARRSKERKKTVKSSVSFCAFWDLICTKATHKMLVKWTPGLNLINVLYTAFTHIDPNVQKKTVKSAASFGTFGTYERKSCT